MIQKQFRNKKAKAIQYDVNFLYSKCKIKADQYQ